MDKYEAIANRYGVELEPFTSDYLNLYGDGVGLLKRVVKQFGGTVISTEDIEEFLKKEKRVQKTLDRVKENE